VNNFISENEDKIRPAKKFFGSSLFYRIDDEDKVWLNFDYTGHYPGAKYMDEKILGILNI